MVDRIVPATTEADRKLVVEATGLYDAWPVVTEPFTQWVIEDNFPGRPPDFGAVGVQFVANVRPFEMMKLRMLNGSHSTIAYLGYLAGYEFVSEAIGDPAFRVLIRELMTEEVMSTLAEWPRRSSPLSRCVAGAFREPGAQASYLADRHGRKPEASAAAARDDSRQASPRTFDRSPLPRSGRLDAVRVRH